MKHYPSINEGIKRDLDVIVFDKLDGSNIRAEWSRKKGVFYKFGSRNRLIDGKDPVLGRAPELLREKYERDLSPRFKDLGCESVICFFEFFGPSSFAGWHDVNERERDIVLFDIAPYKKGILAPDEFLRLAHDLHTPSILHRGRIDDAFIEHVRSGELPGMTFEGVVCKAPGVMFKVKNRAWLARLKERCGSNEKLYEQLR